MPLRRRTRGFLIAVALVVVATLIRAALAPVLGDRAPLFTFVLAIIATAAQGGFWPGALATVLGGLCGLTWFFPPVGTFNLNGSSGLIAVGLYVLIGLATSFVCEILIGSRERLAKQQRELEQARAENREAQRRMITILEGMSDAFLACDSDWRITHMNAAAERIHSMNRNDVLRRDWWQVFSPVLGTAAETEMRLAMAQRHPRRFETFYEPYARYFEAYLFPVEGGGLAALSHDVTERRRAEDSLRDSEARFRALTEASPALVLQLDTRGVCTYANPPCLEFFGAQPAELLGREWHPSVHPEDAEAYGAALSRAQRTQGRFRQRVRLGDRAGRWRWLEAYAQPWFGASGDFAGHVCMFLDVTEGVLAEQSLRDSDRRKDEFIAILAHELRNPLGPLRNAARLLDLKAPADLELRQPVEMIERQVALMARMIDDLMDVSRIARGVFELRLERLDFEGVVESAIDASRHEVEARDHTLTTRMPETPIVMLGDRQRLVQVISNLIGNAANYTPPGGHIAVGGRREADTLELSVEDDGIGIAPDKLAEIFELFARADRSLERQGGLGIGLTLARDLVELHHGSIEAHSEGIGHGSRFVVRLPIVGVSSAPAETPASVAKVEPRRILVADDNRDAAESLRLILELAGHQVRVALDGEAALAAAAEFQPEVAFLDIGMPGLNGYEVARQIRERSWGKSVHLVALTGWGQERDRQAARDSGFDDHVVKPIAPELLERLVAQTPPRVTTADATAGTARARGEAS